MGQGFGWTDSGKKAEAPKLPFDLEIEFAIVGLMLSRPQFIDVASAEIEHHHFYDPLIQRIFDMTVCLHAEGEVSPMLVASVMKNDPAAGEVDIAEFIRSLALSAPVTQNMREMCRVLRDLAFRRDLIRIGEDLAVWARDNPDGVGAQAMADGATEALLQSGVDKSEPLLTAYEIAQETIRDLENAKAGKALPVVRTGLYKLDRETGGLRAQDLIIILGKSGMGKSALMGSVAMNMVLDGTPVIVFSLEMTKRQWIERMVCDYDFRTAEKAMWYSRVRNGRLSDEEFSRFVLASQQFRDLPLEICDLDGLSMAQISARARAFKAKMAAKHQHEDGTPKTVVVMIDYLQIVEPADPRETRERQVNRMARGAKSLGKKAHCVVIAGSQMNEADEGRAKEERRPRASDARESKGIMNEADQMFAPWRPAVAVENQKPLAAADDSPDMLAWYAQMREVAHKFELLGLKNRHGRRFDIHLWAEMGANAVRDEDPAQSRGAAAEAAADMLAGLEQ